MDESTDGREQKTTQATFRDIFFSFVLMGWTAFGGPAAHIGIFQKAFVEVSVT